MAGQTHCPRHRQNTAEPVSKPLWLCGLSDFLKFAVLCASRHGSLRLSALPASVSAGSWLAFWLCASVMRSLSITSPDPGAAPGQGRPVAPSGWGLARTSSFGQQFSGQSQSGTESAGQSSASRCLETSQPFSPVRRSVSRHAVFHQTF